MRKRTAVIGATTQLLVIGSVAASSAVALASEDITTPEIRCNYYHTSGETGNIEVNHTLTATATYEENRVTMTRTWKTFSYRIDISVSSDNSTEPHQTTNNVNIRIHEASDPQRIAFNWRSADNRRYGQQYHLSLVDRPTTPIVDGVRDMVVFEAIFDHPLFSDPRCVGWRRVGTRTP